jgi:hypothetical protein
MVLIKLYENTKIKIINHILQNEVNIEFHLK